MKKLVVASFVLVGCGLLGCGLLGCGPQGGTDVGNGIAEVDVRGYEDDGTPKSSQQALTLRSGVDIGRVLVAYADLRIQPGTDCSSDDGRVDVAGPLVADLVNGGFIGGAEMISVMVGPVCELRFDHERLDAESAPPGTPPELIDASVYVEGTRADGTAFVVRTDNAERLNLKSKDGAFNLAAGTTGLFISYELGSWIEALNLDTLTGDPIVIDQDNNSAALSAFDDAVKASIRLFEDADKDGELDPAERSEEDALGEIED